MRILFFLFLLCTTFAAKASHIIGGEIHYEYLGNDQYRVIVKIYRDCTGIGFDQVLPLTVHNATGELVAVYDLTSPVITEVPPPPNECLTVPPDVCVEEAYYEIVINLPEQEGGYSLTYQRCCRNNDIENVSLGQSPGATFTTNIPGPPHWGNSDPSFSTFPPTIICANFPLSFNHAATDIDGDSLVYALCESYEGAGPDTLPIGCPTCQLPDPATPPPYTSAVYIPPYNGANPLGGSPPLAIDPVTGLLTGTPNNVGRFVVAVCVSEYRDGALVTVHRRDFQFNVSECTESVQAFANPGVTKCNDYTVAFSDSSVGAFNQIWNFGTNNNGDTTSQSNPVFTYPEPGNYEAIYVVNPGTLCSDTAFVEVNIIDTSSYELSPSTIIYLGQSYTLNATNGINYVWTPDSTLSSGDVQSPVASPTVTTTYTVTIMFDSACDAVDTVVVGVLWDPLLVFPNAFTPNGDGVNDRFGPFYYGFINVEYFRVYNRWGELVYETNTLQPWDGTYKGKNQETGTYAYYMVGTGTLTGRKFNFQGNVTLLR